MITLFKKSVAILNKPWLVLGIAAVITVVMAAGMPKLRIDNEMKNFLPANHPVRTNYDKFEEIFGSNSTIFLALKHKEGVYSKTIISYVKKLTEDLENINQTLPIENISKLLNINEEETQEVIEGLGQVYEEVTMKDMDTQLIKIHKNLSNKQYLIDELSWEDDFATKLSKSISKVNRDDLFKYYLVPIEETKSILSTDFIRGDGEKLIVEKLFTVKDKDGNTIDNPEINDQSLKDLKSRVESWETYQGGLVSYEKKPDMTTIIITLDPRSGTEIRQIIKNKITKILETDLGKQKVVKLANGKRDIVKIDKYNSLQPQKGIHFYISGEPVISDEISRATRKDLSQLFPFVVIVIILALFLSFRNFQGVFYPMVSVILSTIWTLGLMAWMNIPLNQISTVLPVILIATGSAYGIHLMNSYFHSSLTNNIDALKKSVSSVGLAIMMAGLTTAAGFGSNTTSQVVLIKDFGIFASIGVFFAIIITLYVIPSMIIVTKRPKKMYHFENSEKNDFISSFLNLISSFVIKQYKFIAILTVLFVGIMLFGSATLTSDMSSVKFFQPQVNIRVVDSIMNSKLAGTQSLSFVASSEMEEGVIEPNLFKMIEEFTKEVKTKFPEVKKVFSLNNMIKKMNQEMNGGDKKYYTIPENKQKIIDYLMLYSGSLTDYINFKAAKDKTQIKMVINRVSANRIREIENFYTEFFLKRKETLEKYKITLTLTDHSHFSTVANDLILNGQIKSIVTSLILIIILLYIILQNTTLTFLAIIPISLGVITNFGLMGLTGRELNIGTSLVASVAIGVGVDYAIHYTTHYKEERKHGKSINDAIRNTTNMSGRAILYNMFSVTLGFLVLLFSEFIPLNDFGLLISACMLATGFGSLIIIPMTLKLFSKKEVQE